MILGCNRCYIGFVELKKVILIFMSNVVRNCIVGNLLLDILNFKLLNVNIMENFIFMYYIIYFGVYLDFRIIRYL